VSGPRWIALATTALVAACALTAAIPSAEGFFDERCEYVEAGPPGARGNRLVVVGEEISFRRDGVTIRTGYRGPRCIGPTATVHNIDRIVVRRTEHEGVDIYQDKGRFGPGATPERFGSEIEFALETGSIEVAGTDGPDSIRVRTLPGERVALNLDVRADGPRPDYDLVLTDIPSRVGVHGGDGDDKVDARRLTGMSGNGLYRMIRLFGEAGDDVIFGSPGSEWQIQDGRGDDLVIAGEGSDSVSFGPGRDTIVGGPGDDDLTYRGFYPRRSRRDPPDRIFGGGGDEQIIDLNGSSDLIRCGPGRDDVERERIDRLSDCEHLR